MRRYDLISGAVLFLFGLVILFYAPQFDLGSFSEPGPGFMSFFAGLIICIFSSITFFVALRNKSSKVEKIWVEVKFQKLIFTMLILLIYTFVFEKLGFMICTFFLILTMVRFVGYQTWFKSILTAIASTILSYLLFQTWLQTQLPRGIFGF